MSSPAFRRPAAFLVAVAAAFAILAVAILPFLTPAWLGPAQDRAQVTAWTGFSRSDVRVATDALVHDLVFGPPAFDVQVAGAPVLEERERAHLRDVRGVFGGLAVIVLASLAILAVAVVRARRTAWLWRSVRAGALGLIGATLGLGAIAAVAFDQVFEVFHRLFFAGGTYTFDPRTDRLVQLFPDQLWFETALGVGVLMVALAVLVTWAAVRRAARAGAPLSAGGATTVVAPRLDGAGS